MNCLRCGDAVGEDAVFCAKCLRSMAEEPMISSPHVMLPHREPASISKKSNSRKQMILVDAEEIKKLHFRVKRLRIVWLFTSLLLVSLGIYTFRLYHLKTTPAPGQNYSTVVDTTAPPVTIS